MYEEATNIDRRLVDGKVYELSNCLFVKYSSISDCLTVLDDRSHPKVSAKPSLLVEVTDSSEINQKIRFIPLLK